MLISYLATKVIVLPFDGVAGLLTTPFKIALKPGTSYEDAFKTSTDPTWQQAWTGRIQPYLEDYRQVINYNHICMSKKVCYFNIKTCISKHSHIVTNLVSDHFSCISLGLAKDPL